MYWGPVTATRDWCEHNYVGPVPYLAEFWVPPHPHPHPHPPSPPQNSISSLYLLLVGAVGMATAVRMRLEPRFVHSYFWLAVVGVGSFAFHGTLLRGLQLLDELPMIYGTLVFVYCATHHHADTTRGAIVAALAAMAAALTWGTVASTDLHHLAYVAMVVYLCANSYANTTRMNDPALTALFRHAFATYALGGVFWVVDNVACAHVRGAQLHAWWHVLSGHGTFEWIAFMAATRARTLGRVAVVRRWGGVWNYVEVKDAK
jgi:dihydroceramidase